VRTPSIRESLGALRDLLRGATPGAPTDRFGMAPDLIERAGPILDFLYRAWWRVETRDIGLIPAGGPVMIVANHGGSAPWDALVLRLALLREHPARRDLRPLLDEAALARPVAGPALRKLGAVPATPENALNILSDGQAVAVFPEGGAPRPWPLRYRVGAFGRGGFAKLALRTGAAVIPCAVVGSEEAGAPMARPGFLAETLRLPLFATMPGLPLGPLDDLPLPSRWLLRFGAPVDLGPGGPESAADPEVVSQVTARTRERLQAMLDETVAARRSVFF
jgi:1-acyl-sn-glycerol-3-phosphate acyltransferase